ncbi:glycosyltransferase family 2 protein [Nitriliruptoraceae bacterium ZYF776]|nr:glycosyltransferase family 2 protein [Profundirhabdus halotolerans]
MTTADDLEVVTIVRGRAAHLRNLVLGLEHGHVRPAALHVVVMGGPDPVADLPTGAVRIVRHEVSPGHGALPLAHARNLGVAATEAPLVVLLDVDCIPAAGLVDAYARRLRRDDVVAMGQVRYLGPGAADGAWEEASLHAASVPHPGRPVPATAGPTDDHARFWSLSFGVRLATYDRLGGFDEGYVGYGAEDTDLAFTIRGRDVPLWWEPAAVAYHQHHATYDPPLQHLDDIVANARRFRAKWGTWPMEGWLRAFAERGLVTWDPDGDLLERRRAPTGDELTAARRTSAIA